MFNVNVLLGNTVMGIVYHQWGILFYKVQNLSVFPFFMKKKSFSGIPTLLGQTRLSTLGPVMNESWLFKYIFCARELGGRFFSTAYGVLHT